MRDGEEGNQAKRMRVNNCSIGSCSQL